MSEPTGTLILVCGLSGAGKTTIATKLEADRNAIRMCPDDWIEAMLENPENTGERDRLRDPVEILQWELAKSYLRKGLTVTLENGFWAEEERSQYAMEALELDARVELVYVEAPDYAKLWERVLRRNADLSSGIWVLTEAEHRDAWNLFQPPTSEELNFYDCSQIVPWTDD